jgi:hypothetical protein
LTTPNGECAPGFELRFVTNGEGYALILADKTDPCMFAYVSDQKGLIYKAEVIR